MTAIQKALAAIDSQGPEGQISYRAAAKNYGVVLSTLTRRHQNKTRSRAAFTERQRLISPQHEAELVKFIQRLSERALPPTRAMIKKYVATIAKWEPSDSWVTRFLRRNRNTLTSKTSTGIDRDRFKADNIENYNGYFRLLYDKLEKYNVMPHNIYNMDEKGFLLGVTSRSKRVFSKQFWDEKKVTAALRDGSREWITVLGCICADGSWVDPLIIFEGKRGLREAWLQHLDPTQHRLFFAHSQSGWSNNDLGLSWLKQVFQRQTKDKARRDYRLLLLDGHGSHVTPDFIDYCDSHRILLAVLPPHASHRLQPLDIGMFKPLSSAYTQELNDMLQRSQGLTDVRKSDFLRLFWAAWTHAFMSDKILSSFRATGVHPRDADVVLKRLKISTPQHNIDTEVGEHGDGDSWRQLSNLVDAAVSDSSKVEAQRVKQAIHSLQVNNELLHHENQELRGEITTKKHRKKHNKILELQQYEEYQTPAVIWSPSAVDNARAQERQRQHQEELENRQKAERREARAAATAYRKKLAVEAKTARELQKVAKQKEREARVKELEAARAQKARNRAAATIKKLVISKI